MKNQSARAYGMLISAMLIFGTIGIFRRYIPLSSGLLACTRGFLGALCLLVFLLCRKKKNREKLGGRQLALLILSGGMMGFNWILLFEAYNYTSVAVATLCYYMQPTIVILLSPVLLSEKLTAKRFLCALLGVGGMVLVSGVAEHTGAGAGDARGILLGLGAALLYAGVVILNKKTDGGDAYGRTVIQLFSAAVCLLPYLLLTEDFSALSLDFSAVVCILMLGLVHTGLAYALYFGSMRGLSAQSIAVLSYTDPVSALILSALVLHERLSLPGVLGAVLIIGAAILGEVNLARKKPLDK